MNRAKLEALRDSFKEGDTVRVIKNAWDRPGTIGRIGKIVPERDQFTPTVRVRFDNGLSHTFSPDDVELVT